MEQFVRFYYSVYQIFSLQIDFVEKHRRQSESIHKTELTSVTRAQVICDRPPANLLFLKYMATKYPTNPGI